MGSGDEGGGASWGLFGGTPARSRCSVPLCSAVNIQTSLSDLSSSAHHLLHPQSNLHLRSVSPRLGSLAVCFPPRSLKKPRPNEARALLPPKLSLVVVLAGGEAGAALALLCKETDGCSSSASPQGVSAEPHLTSGSLSV